MGNTSSDSLDHSFKRLRLSQTEQLPLLSSSCTSPKRKGALNIPTKITDTLDRKSVNDTNYQLPIALWHSNTTSSSSFNYSSEMWKPVINTLPDRDFPSDDELIYFVKSSTTSIISNDKVIHTNRLSSSEQIAVHLLDAKIIPELSDDDLMEHVKHAYIQKEYN
ncbi:unnamed protein product [Rotaria sordida]|uniref:Uncharacterized protein n=1 Tax=Rotaria sordida TaxID=392033 RepID=A0A814H4X9_9BILA|nr:unnamed protein product [Rotaria sordida]